MRKILLANVVGLAALVGTASAWATEDSETINATVTTSEAITIDCTGGSTVSFGELAIENGNAAGATITIASTSEGSVTNSNEEEVHVLTPGGSATCSVSGVAANATISLTAAGAVTLTNDNGEGDTLAATLTASPTTLAEDGTVHIGGSLTIPAAFATTAAQDFGTYSGTTTLTVTE